MRTGLPFAARENAPPHTMRGENSKRHMLLSTLQAKHVRKALCPRIPVALYRPYRIAARTLTRWLAATSLYRNISWLLPS